MVACLRLPSLNFNYGANILPKNQKSKGNLHFSFVKKCLTPFAAKFIYKKRVQ